MRQPQLAPTIGVLPPAVLPLNRKTSCHRAKRKAGTAEAFGTFDKWRFSLRVGITVVESMDYLFSALLPLIFGEL
jgi:hypothetical protein